MEKIFSLIIVGLLATSSSFAASESTSTDTNGACAAYAGPEGVRTSCSKPDSSSSSKADKDSAESSSSGSTKRYSSSSSSS